jgi:hypothetical protein
MRQVAERVQGRTAEHPPVEVRKRACVFHVSTVSSACRCTDGDIWRDPRRGSTMIGSVGTGSVVPEGWFEEGGCPESRGTSVAAQCSGDVLVVALGAYSFGADVPVEGVA